MAPTNKYKIQNKYKDMKGRMGLPAEKACTEAWGTCAYRESRGRRKHSRSSSKALKQKETELEKKKESHTQTWPGAPLWGGHLFAPSPALLAPPKDLECSATAR